MLDIPTQAHWIANIYHHAELALLQRAAQETQQLGLQPETLAAARQLAHYEQHTNYILSHAHRQTIQELHNLIQQAANEGHATAALDLQQLGYNPTITSSQHATIQKITQELTTTLNRLHTHILRQIPDHFRELQAIATGQTTLGILTRQQASQYMLDQLAKQGITHFTDRTGRKWRADTYTEMAARTGAMNAHINARLDTYDAAGHHLVLVSDSPRECELCRQWEFKVLSLDGNTGRRQVPDWLTGGTTTVTVAATVDEARAAGLLHPNCTHNLTVYVPGATVDTATIDNPETYERTQEQRRLERGLRGWQRRYAAALDDSAADYAARKMREWDQRIENLVDSDPLLRRRPEREDPFTAR